MNLREKIIIVVIVVLLIIGIFLPTFAYAPTTEIVYDWIDTGS